MRPHLPQLPTALPHNVSASVSPQPQPQSFLYKGGGKGGEEGTGSKGVNSPHWKPPPSPHHTTPHLPHQTVLGLQQPRGQGPHGWENRDLRENAFLLWLMALASALASTSCTGLPACVREGVGQEDGCCRQGQGVEHADSGACACARPHGATWTWCGREAGDGTAHEHAREEEARAPRRCCLPALVQQPALTHALWGE